MAQWNVECDDESAELFGATGMTCSWQCCVSQGSTNPASNPLRVLDSVDSFHAALSPLAAYLSDFQKAIKSHKYFINNFILLFN